MQFNQTRGSEEDKISRMDPSQTALVRFLVNGETIDAPTSRFAIVHVDVRSFGQANIIIPLAIPVRRVNGLIWICLSFNFFFILREAKQS